MRALTLTACSAHNGGMSNHPNHINHKTRPTRQGEAMRAAAQTVQILALRTAGYEVQTMGDVELLAAFDDVLDGLAAIAVILADGVK